MPTSTLKLYTIEGIDYDAIIALYRQICVEGVKDIDTNTISVYSGDIDFLQVR